MKFSSQLIPITVCLLALCWYTLSSSVTGSGMDEENLNTLDEFLKKYPHLYGKMLKIERLMNATDRNETEIAILHENLLEEMQPRIMDECDEVFCVQHEALYKNIFVYKNQSHIEKLSNASFMSNELTRSAISLTVYRDKLVRAVKKLVRSGAQSVIGAERRELGIRINDSLLTTETALKRAIQGELQFETDVLLQTSFCNHILMEWLEPHFVQMERVHIIEQKIEFVPIEEAVRKKIIHQCMIYMPLQTDYVQNVVNNKN